VTVRGRQTRPPSICRRGARHVAGEAAGLPAYANDLRAFRGRCLARRCTSRWGIVRLSLDFRDPLRVDRLATMECAVCGRVWRRVREPSITSSAGYQAVRLTLILPATMKRWFARGRWHAEGADAVVLPEADLGDLDEAARAHRVKSEALASRKAAVKAKRETEDVAQHHRTMDLLARLAAMDEANVREDAV
jgi:hypothetical protein